jgi:hypothetical protein
VDRIRRGGLDYFLILTLAFCMLTFYYVLKETHETKISGDSVLYFAYMQSLIEDGDLEFSDDYLEHDTGMGPNQLLRTATGYTGNYMPLGPAVLWAPFYLAGKGYAAVAGVKTRAEELKLLIYAVGLGTVFYSCLAIILCYLFLRSHFDRLIAFFATMAAFFCTTFIFYSVFMKIGAHAPGAFCVTLFLWYADRTGEHRGPLKWFVLGLTAGLVVMVRWMYIVALVWLLLEQISMFRAAPEKKRMLLDRLPGYCLFAVAFLLVNLPQIVIFWIIYGPFGNPLGHNANRVELLRPEIINILFSTRNGLFTWHPVTLISIVGLFLLIKRDRNLAFRALALTVCAVLLASMVGDWWGGASFGMRRLTSLFPLFALGLAAAASVGSKVWLTCLLCLVLLFSAWNFEMALLVFNREMPLEADPQQRNPLDPDRAMKYNSFGYPLSFPFTYAQSLLMGFINPDEADFIRTTYLFCSQKNMEGRISALYPSFRRGFRPPAKLGSRPDYFRSLEGSGEVLVSRLAIGRTLRLKLDAELIGRGLGKKEIALLEVDLNGRFTKILPLARFLSDDLPSVRAPNHAWNIGLNKITIALWTMGKRSFRNMRQGELPADRGLLKPPAGRVALRIYSLDFEIAD